MHGGRAGMNEGLPLSAMVLEGGVVLSEMLLEAGRKEDVRRTTHPVADFVSREERP